MENQNFKLRRSILKAGVAFALTGFNALPVLADFEQKKKAVRELAFFNLHTGESLKTDYWADNNYLPDALADINHILRDFRNDQVLPIETALLDLLYELHTMLDTSQPFHIVSGYRSPETNALLTASSNGVAKDSLHMQGKAIDLYIEGIPLNELRHAAIKLHGGGVGYYPNSNFVHVDTGHTRSW